jgi:hypothetical protein
MTYTIQSVTEDMLDGEQLKEWNAIKAIRERNASRIAEIESLNVALDLSVARMEHLMSGLLAIGVLTMDQWLALQKDWELTLRKQTKDILQQRRAQYAEELKRQRKMQAQQTGRTESGLIVPPSAVQ